MKKHLHAALAKLLICALPLLVPAAAVGLELSYTVTLEDLASRTLHIELIIADWQQHELRLHGVPSYMDNPTAAARGSVCRDLSVARADGHQLAVRDTTGDDGEPVFLVSEALGIVRVTYDLVVDFISSKQSESYPIMLPFMDQERAWLYGNYVFCYPELASRKPRGARVPVRIRVNFSLPGNMPLVGPPGNQVELNNLHELMSLQFGLGAFQVERNVVVGIPVRIITPEESSFSPAERVWLMQRTSDIVKTVTGIFSGTPYPAMSFFYFRGEGIGGLEGAYTCQAYVPEEVDLSNGENRKRTTFAMTALHEFFHTWNPIGLFARDDPWFKEGVTTYYGIVLSYRLGWLKTDSWVEWQGYYTKLLADNPLFKEVALSDPRIWDHEYDSENWRTLTYDRGLAVTLLLDVRIREATDNRKSLDSVLPLLFQRYLHNSFSRADLLAAIHKATGFDATDFFAGYVESITPPSAEEVAAGLARAKELKVFAPLNP